MVPICESIITGIFILYTVVKNRKKLPAVQKFIDIYLKTHAVPTKHGL